MKFIILTVCLAAISTFAKAQQAYPTSAQFSIGLNTGLPLGKLHDSHTFILGGYIQEAIPVAKALHVIINLGYNKFFGKSTFNLQSPNTPYVDFPDADILAAKGGLRYYLSPKFYLQGEAGIALVLKSPQSSYDAAKAFIYSPKIGYAIAAGGKSIIDVSLRYEATNNYADSYRGNISSISVGVAYGF